MCSPTGDHSWRRDNLGSRRYPAAHQCRLPPRQSVSYEPADLCGELGPLIESESGNSFTGNKLHLRFITLLISPVPRSFQVVSEDHRLNRTVLTERHCYRLRP